MAAQGRHFEKLRIFMTFYGLPGAEVAHVEVLGHPGHPGHAVGLPSLHLCRKAHQKVLKDLTSFHKPPDVPQELNHAVFDDLDSFGDHLGVEQI